MPYKNTKKQKEYQAKWHKDNKERRRNRVRTNTKIRQRRNLRFVQRVKMRGCTVCGYKRCSEAIDFHHLSDKDISISSAVDQRRWGIKRLKQEIRKCVRVCSNCHREIHAGILQIGR